MCLVTIKIKMIGMLLNFVHRQVLKNIQQRNLTGFITVPLYQLQYGMIKQVGLPLHGRALLSVTKTFVLEPSGFVRNKSQW